MYTIFKDKRGFTMMEFVVTIAIIGTLISVALPSYHSTNLLVREKTSIASMNLIKEAFFQYFYRMHIKGDPHFPSTPTNDDNLMDEQTRNTNIVIKYQPQSTGSYLVNKDHERIINPLLPPERRNSYIVREI